MANKNEAKIKFTAETGDFNEAISKANSSLTELRAELKLNETQMKANGESVEGLEKKHSLLEKQLGASKDKIAALEGKLEAAVRNFGEGSNEVDKWRTQLLNAKTAQVKLETSLRECESELDEFKKSADKAEDATDDLENTVEDAADAARDAEGGFTVLKGALSDLVASGIKSAIGGIGDLASSVMDLEEETKEYRTIMASLDSSSELSGYTAEETAASFKQLNGVLGDTQSSATTTANLQAIGLEQGKLQSLTDGVIGAWAKYGDSIPIDGLAEAINHTSQLGEVQGTLADVLEWGGISVDDFNDKLAKCSTETERADLIAKMLADQGLTEAGKAWQETNSDIVNLNNAQAEYEENTAMLSEKIAPVTASVRDGFNGVFEKVLELTSNTNLEGFATTVSEAFGTFTNEILPKIVDGFTSFANGVRDATTWMKEHQGVVIAVAAVIGTLVTAIGLYNAVNAVKAAMDAANVTTVWALVSAHIAQAAAAMAAVAPYVLIVAAIAAVIAIIVLCIKHWDDIVAAVKKCWETVKATLSKWGDWINSNVVQPIVKFFTGLRDKIYSAFSNIGGWFKEKFQNAKESAVNAWSNVKAKFSEIKNKIVSAFSNIKEKLAQPFEKARDAIKKVVDKIKGFFSGLKIELPKIKLPHFSISGKFSLDPPSVPKLSIEWYKDGGILTAPTIFGMNDSRLMAGGEAGPEAILPIDRLEGYIANAIERAQNVVSLDTLAAAVEDLANRPIELAINGRQFALATASDGDSVNGLRSTFKSRDLIMD